ncbi:hypothetical protein GCM10028809_55850 [Spirosoma gilvum]
MLMLMTFHLRFYAYDDAQRQTFHYLLADTEASSLQGFAQGQAILLIEQREGSLAQTYMIANPPTTRKPPRLTVEPETVQAIDIFVVSEKDWNQSSASDTQSHNPWYGPTL